MATFAERLRCLRDEKGLTRKAFSELTGISDSSINMYERGEREPSLETLEIFADFFNVDMDYLLGRQDIQRTVDITAFFTSTTSKNNALPFELSEHERRVFIAYHEQSDAQPYVDKILGIDPEEETYNIAKVARKQQPLELTKEGLKKFGDSADSAPNRARDKNLF